MKQMTSLVYLENTIIKDVYMIKEIKKKEVYVGKTGEYNTYRIPSLLYTTKGILLAFAEGRKLGSGDAGAIDILLKRSLDNGETFEEIQVLAGNDKDTFGNPSAVYDAKRGRVILIFNFNYGDRDEREIRSKGAPREVYVMHSEDEGITWSKPKNITSDVKNKEWRWFATGPNHGIQLDSGRLIFSGNHSLEDDSTHSHIMYSDDGGYNWNKGAIMTKHTNECCPVILKSKKIMVNMRTYYGLEEFHRYVAICNEDGTKVESWYIDNALIEPKCQGSIIDMDDLLVFSNPASLKREKLTIKVSRDMGKTWQEELCINEGHSAYSDLAVIGKNKLVCLYENGANGPYEKLTMSFLGIRK